MGAWLTQVFDWGYQLGQLIGGGNQGPNWQAQINRLWQAMGNFAEYATTYLDAIARGLDDMGVGWQRSTYSNERFTTNMEAAFGAIEFALNILVTETIPGTIHHIEGKIVSQHIGRIDSILGNPGSRSPSNLWGWRNSIVDPTIRDERSLRKAFTDFMGDWQRFAGWLGGAERFPDLPYGSAKNWVAGLAFAWAYPSSYMDLLFARRADNAGGPYSVATTWLADGAHQGALDDLLALLIDSSTDRYRHILAAGEAILNSAYP